MSTPHGSSDCDSRCPDHGDSYDSLVAALRAVPCLPHDDGDHVLPDYPALAAAAREWVRTQMPPKDTGHAGTFAYADAYNECLADVARRLGL